MVLLVERLSKLYAKLENHHHHHHHHLHHHNHQSEADVLSAALQAFRSDVSNCLNQLLLSSKPGSSEILSFPWIQQSFELIPLINRAFAKLVVDIDCPMSSWEIASVDEYLNCSLYLLDLLNSVTSSVSHLSHARLSFAHALSLVENSPSLAIRNLKPPLIQPPHESSSIKEYKGKENKEFSSCKEKVVHQALMEISNIGIWVCGVVLASLSGEAKPYLEIKQLICNSSYNGALLIGLDPCISEVIVEKGGVLKEVKELNNAAASLESAIVSGKSCDDEAKDLEKKLGVFERQLEALEKQVDNLFSVTMAGRNELLAHVRQRKQ